MPNPRIPAAKARVSGADVTHPGRHKARAEPKVAALGEPSRFLDDYGARAWEGFKREMPWLGESDRALVEIASLVRGRLLAGQDVGVTALSMLQAILGKMGGSPADRTKVSVPDGDEGDPEDRFFGGRPN